MRTIVAENSEMTLSVMRWRTAYFAGKEAGEVKRIIPAGSPCNFRNRQLGKQQQPLRLFQTFPELIFLRRHPVFHAEKAEEMRTGHGAKLRQAIDIDGFRIV